MMFGLLVTVLLALVTICLLIAGLIQAASGYRRRAAGAEQVAPPNGGPAKPLGNSGVTKGPASVS
jgi:hypothetical protein